MRWGKKIGRFWSEYIIYPSSPGVAALALIMSVIRHSSVVITIWPTTRITIRLYLVTAINYVDSFKTYLGREAWLQSALPAISRTWNTSDIIEIHVPIFLCEWIILYHIFRYYFLPVKVAIPYGGFQKKSNQYFFLQHCNSL